MLDIPTKFNKKSIDLFKEINRKATCDSDRLPISHVYGSLSGLYSARESTRLPTVSIEDFQDHLNELENLGIDFFYAINSSCLGSLSNKELLKIRATIDRLRRLNVKNFIVAHPIMIGIIKSAIEEAKIKASVILEIDDTKRFQYFAQYVDFINISTKVNRNFTFLKSLKIHKPKIEFLCNEVCLYMCPFRDSHYTIESHRYKENESYPNDYPVDLCYNMMTDVELLRSRFILPEWIQEYENYGSLFKISGRTFPFEFISKTTKAYSSRKSTENILEMFPIVVGSIVNEQNGERDRRTLKMTTTDKYSFLNLFVQVGEKCRYRCPCNLCGEFTYCFDK